MHVEKFCYLTILLALSYLSFPFNSIWAADTAAVIAVEVVDGSKDPVGQRLVYRVKEDFHKSTGFRITEKDESRWRVIIVTMPRFKDSPSSATIYSVVWNLILREENARSLFPYYIDSIIGYSGADAIEGAAEVVVASTDRLITQMRGAVFKALESTKRPQTMRQRR
jgi:hypothetical protein